MTFKELFDRVRVRRKPNDSVNVEVDAWEMEDGRLDFRCKIWSARQAKTWSGNTVEEAYAAFLTGYTGNEATDTDKAEIEKVGEISEAPKAPKAPMHPVDVLRSELVKAFSPEAPKAEPVAPPAEDPDPVPHEERATSTNEPTGY